MTYKVLVDDNYHYMDESERYTLGHFPTLAAAIDASKKIVDEYLLSAYQPGMSAQALWTSYTLYGEDPWIVGEEPNPFSARDYAKRRSEELCAAASSPT